MALIETGLAGGKDEALAAGAQIPAGTYRAQFVGLMNNEESGGKVFNTKAGGKMVKASFKIVEHPDPMLNGKRLPIYNAVIGQFSFSDLANVLPFGWSGGSFDDEPAIGTIVNAKVTVQKDGDYAGNSQLAKLTKL